MGGIGSGRNRYKSDELKRRLGTFQPCKADSKDKSKEVPKTEKASDPKPPKGLSAEARRLWRTVTGGWHLDEAGLFLLGQVVETLDAMREAQAILKTEGLVVVNPKTQVLMAHPAQKIVKDNKDQLLRFWKALGLAVDIKELM